MKWDTAKRHELYVIAFDDPFATVTDKLAAAAEIQRRNSRKHPHQDRNQIKVKGIYPK